MGRELTYESLLADLDHILELPQKSLGTASSLLRKLDQNLERMLDSARIDEALRRSLFKMITPQRASAAELAQSLAKARRSGPMRGDWMRFAERDFAVLKDELLALREYMVSEADFLRFACLREQLGELGGARPEKLFEELHEAGAVSERTWVLLMAQPNSWREALKDRETSKQLAQISAWLLDLQEARRDREVFENLKTTGGASEDVRKK